MEKFDGKERFYFILNRRAFYILNLQSTVTHPVAKANCPSLRAGGRALFSFFLDSLSLVAISLFQWFVFCPASIGFLLHLNLKDLYWWISRCSPTKTNPYSLSLSSRSCFFTPLLTKKTSTISRTHGFPNEPTWTVFVMHICSWGPQEGHHFLVQTAECKYCALNNTSYCKCQ